MEMHRGILLLILFAGCPQILAAEDCVKADFGTVCLDAVQNDKDRTVTISAHNREAYEVTITVNAKLKNMTSSVKLPHTRALDGGFRQPILKFVANPQGDWAWEYSWDWIVGSLNARHDDSIIYDVPYKGRSTVLQGFHGKFSHTGADEYEVDWQMPVGTPVHAAREGTIVAARSTMNKGGLQKNYVEFSNYIWIRHPDGTIGSYEHLKQGGVAVKVGDRVSRKQLIGYSGNTGWTSGPHLHFVVSRPVDGFKYQSFPIRFQTAAGIITPIEGQSYTSLTENTVTAARCTRLRFRQTADMCDNCTAPPWNGELNSASGDVWVVTYVDGNNKSGTARWRLISANRSEMTFVDDNRNLFTRFDLMARKGYQRRGSSGAWAPISNVLSTNCQ